MKLPENKSQVFTYKTSAKAMRDFSQNYFGAVSSDKGFVQRSWLLIHSGRKEDNCYMCPSRKTRQANLGTVKRKGKQLTA